MEDIVKPQISDNIKAIIFDLDGTMVDSMWMWRAIDIEYLGRFRITLPEGLQSEIEGMSFHDTAVYFKQRFGIQDSIEKMMEDWNQMAWDKYTYEVPLKPGITEFLKKCRAKDIKLGIATSNSRELAENILKVHHIKEFFSCILTGSEITNGKPAPDIYLAAAKELNVAPKDCLVFEDIIPGIQAGINAGMKVCAVEDEYSFASRKEKIKLADYYIENYLEILDSN